VNNLVKKLGYLLAGVFFGFTLSRSGASEYNYIYYMFTGENFKLAFLMATAIVTGAIGLAVLKWSGNKDINGQEIKISKKPLNQYTIVGGILFGIGWAISGACPGTALVQIGEGKIIGLFTVFGIVCGTYIYALLVQKNPQI